MPNERHKRKKNHILIITSDSADSKSRGIRLKGSTIWLIISVLCVLAGGFFGYFLNASVIWNAVEKRAEAQQDRIRQLQAEIDTLNSSIADKEKEKEKLLGDIAILNDQKALLSDSLNQQIDLVDSLSQQIEAQFLPTAFPLTGAAKVEEVAGDMPICVFTANAGTNVIAAANGTVVDVRIDPEYGNIVYVDHGNGYTTLYKAPSDVCVRKDTTVVRGATLFMIFDNNVKVGYQIMNNGVFINPMEMIEVDG